MDRSKLVSRRFVCLISRSARGAERGPLRSFFSTASSLFVGGRAVPSHSGRVYGVARICTSTLKTSIGLALKNLKLNKTNDDEIDNFTCRLPQEWSYCKSISVDDSHLFVDVPSNCPERITSVEHGGVQPEMGRTGRWPIRVGGPVEPTIAVKVEGSGCFWLRASSHEIATGPQA